MKQKDLKKVAQQIATAELIIQTSSDHKKIEQAKKLIMKLSHSLDIRDMDYVDELVQKNLEKNN